MHSTFPKTKFWDEYKTTSISSSPEAMKLDWIKIYSNKPLIIKSKTKDITERRNDCWVVFSSDVYLVLVTYNHAKKGSLSNNLSVNQIFEKLNENFTSLQYKKIQLWESHKTYVKEEYITSPKTSD